MLKKYAFIKNGIVDNISNIKIDGYIEVESYVFAGMKKTEDSFEYPIIEQSETEILFNKISKAKDFLETTDHKFISDYTLKDDETLEDIADIKATRAEARTFIRANK